MNKAYFIMRSEGLGHEMYHCWGSGSSTTREWTFKIAEANHWVTDRVPKIVAARQDSKEVSVVAITKAEYFKRVLQGK